MPPPWTPRSSIDEKEKTGDAEQLRILWTVYTAVVGGEAVIGTDADELRKKFSADRVAVLQKQVDEVAGLSWLNRTVEEVATKLGKLKKYDELKEIRGMVEKISQALGKPFNAFVVNLILFDHRTAADGRARKTTSGLRGTAEEPYMRPYYGPVPVYIAYLLSAVVPGRRRIDGGAPVAIKRSTEYLPPTRFTATFPLLLTGAEKHPQVLVDPQVPSKPISVKGKYMSLESFGFSEPSYCAWTVKEGAETPGTRLSAGAYSLDGQYMEQIIGLWKELGPQQVEYYARYGSVGLKHLEMLRDKFDGGAGRLLGVAWLRQMVDLARGLTQEAAKCQRAPEMKSRLAPLFAFLHSRIDTREIKIEQIKKEVVKGDHTLFEYLWVFESSLWEFAVMSASCLPMVDVARVLRAVFPGYEPTLSTSEVALSEELTVGKIPFVRHYFPSGTHAADQLHAALVECGCGTTTLRVVPEDLSSFTPYFEFYQQQGSFLGDKELARQKKLVFPHGQIWLNISEGLHGEIISNKVALGDIGTTIAAWAWAYIEGILAKKKLRATKLKQRQQNPIVQQVPVQIDLTQVPIRPIDEDYIPDYELDLADLDIDFTKMFVVIDYTKFGGDMPNDRLYTILADLRAALEAVASGQVLDVMFVRSNLKYNTGSLDWYQCGEVLVATGGAADKLKLHTKLSTRTQEQFDGDWTLGGEYVPLMKRTYLLVDAIGFGRWDAYGSMWVGAMPSLGGRLTQLDVQMLAAQARIADVVQRQVVVLLSYLDKDVDKPFYKKYLTQETRTAVHEFTAFVNTYQKVIGSLSWKESRILHEVAGYINAIVKGVEGVRVEVSDRSSEAAKNFSRYRSRLVSARANLLPSVSPSSLKLLDSFAESLGKTIKLEALPKAAATPTKKTLTLKSSLAAKWATIPNGGGGNCLFLALAQGIGGDTVEERAATLRADAINFIRLRFDADVWWGSAQAKLTYLNYMAQDGAWGGDFELAALSLSLNKTIIVHSVQYDQTVDYNTEATGGTIHLYHNGYHYELMRNK